MIKITFALKTFIEFLINISNYGILSKYIHIDLILFPGENIFIFRTCIV